MPHRKLNKYNCLNNIDKLLFNHQYCNLLCYMVSYREQKTMERIMASIEKRTTNEGAVTYRVKVRLKGHPVETATFERITDAKKWVQDTEAAIREGRYFKTSEAKNHTLAEAIDRYHKDVLAHMEDTVNREHYLQWWKQELGAYRMFDVTTALVTECQGRLVGLENKYGRKIGPTTANRYVQALGHVFTVAKKGWGWVEGNPVRDVSKYQESRGRVRFLSDDERNRLLAACQKSENPHLYKVVI